MEMSQNTPSFALFLSCSVWPGVILGFRIRAEGPPNACVRNRYAPWVSNLEQWIILVGRRSERAFAEWPVLKTTPEPP